MDYEVFLEEARFAAKLGRSLHAPWQDVIPNSEIRPDTTNIHEPTTVERLLLNTGRLDSRASVSLAVQAVRLLRSLWKTGAIHGDIKPANLVVSTAGSNRSIFLACVTGVNRDPAIAWARNRGWMIGTPAYVSPEQAAGGFELDFRSDIYSLGATLYHMLAGQPPFDGDDPQSVIRKHMFDEPIPPHQARPGLAAKTSYCALKMMAKRPSERYGTVDSLIDDLSSLLND